MDRNKKLHLYLNKSETHLTVFGKKVLNVLLEQWNNRNGLSLAQEEKKDYQYLQRPRSPKILSFHDTSLLSPAITIPLPPPTQIYSDERLSDLNETGDCPPKVPTTAELTKTLQIHETINNNEFAHPTIVNRSFVDDVLHNTAPNSDEQILKNKVNSIFENGDRNETNDVDWDNMFDSDLFDDVHNKENNTKVNIPDVTFYKNMDIFNIDINNDNDRIKRKTEDNDNPTTIKKSRKTGKKLNEPPNKINKTCNDVSKHSFRKQKYTKTVKNWLNDNESYNNAINDDVDVPTISNATDDREIIESDISKQDSKNKIAVKTDKLKIIVDKTLKANKKVVQAQLANKGGVMKFSKPKTKASELKKAEVTDILVDQDKKEKTVKKFVPPIKSQIPVKDITYEVLSVDDSNVDKLKVLSELDSEVTVNLIYSNGFNQLNRHFTDGACAADSILLGAGGVFYCFKSVGEKSKAALAGILGNNKLISYDAQNVLIYLTSQLQMEIDRLNIYDAKIGASLLDPDNPPENFTDLQKQLSFIAPYTIATECVLQKASWYSTLLQECWTKVKGLLVQDQLWNVFIEIEMKLLPIIAEMERLGISVDLSKLKAMEQQLLDRMKVIEQQCYSAAGKVFQITSSVQVRAILYDELQLDARCNVTIRETLAGGVKSTSETMLRSLVSVHPLPQLILEYRRLHKAHATFLVGIAQHVHDGVITPTWVQSSAATGRIACNNPNLQAIPKAPFSLVMCPDTQDTEGVQVQFRSVYVSRPGHCLLAADFQHVECRVFAHAAGDVGLLHTLHTGHDLFRELAAQWLKKLPESVSEAERSRTKRLVYAALYGAGTRKLMEILDVSYEQALQVAASFNRTFPSLKSFGRRVVSACVSAGGRLGTLCGRVRRFSHISSEDFALRSHAERQAVNFVVQGSAADLCKTAMILTQQELRAHRPRVHARLVLQIHDELVWEVREQDLHAAAGIIKRVMESCGSRCGMSRALPVALSAGTDWAHMADYNADQHA